MDPGYFTMGKLFMSRKETPCSLCIHFETFSELWIFETSIECDGRVGWVRAGLWQRLLKSTPQFLICVTLELTSLYLQYNRENNSVLTYRFVIKTEWVCKWFKQYLAQNTFYLSFRCFYIDFLHSPFSSIFIKIVEHIKGKTSLAL